MVSKLKQARIDAGYTIEEIAKNIRIRKKYLISLEEERYEEIPGAAYAKGYLKLYSDFLKIPTPTDSISIEKVHKPRNDRSKFSFKAQKYLVIISVFLLLLTAVIYHEIFRNTEDAININDLIGYSNDDK